jgi:hypothetical protein
MLLIFAIIPNILPNTCMQPTLKTVGQSIQVLQNTSVATCKTSSQLSARILLEWCD